MYINKGLLTGGWTETFHSRDVCTISMRIAGEGGITINIHNVYNPPPATHNDEGEIDAVRILAQALRMPGEHIVVGDFNLHHPRWCGTTYAYQHRGADQVLQLMREAGVELALPQGTITREAMRGDHVEETTIDLAWVSQTLLGGLVHCRVERGIEQSSDHLPISTLLEIRGMLQPQAIRRRCAWKAIDTERFRRTFKDGIERFKTQLIQTRDQLERVVTGLTHVIQGAIEALTPWSRTYNLSKK